MLGNQWVTGSCKATPPYPSVSQLRKERPKAEDLARVTQEGQQSRVKLGLLSPMAVLLITGPCSPLMKVSDCTLADGEDDSGRVQRLQNWGRLVPRPDGRGWVGGKG